MKNKFFQNWKTIVLCVFIVACIVSAIVFQTKWLIPVIGIIWVSFYSFYILGIQQKPCELFCQNFCKHHRFREVSPSYQHLKTMKKDKMMLTYGHYRHQLDKSIWLQGIYEEYKKENANQLWTGNSILPKEIYCLEEESRTVYFGYINNFVFLFRYNGTDKADKDELKRLVESFMK